MTISTKDRIAAFHAAMSYISCPPRKPMSWKPEVIADETGKWYDNALRFSTKEEAEASAANLAMRWTLVRDHRAVESDDPVNYRWVDGQLQEVKSDGTEEKKD